MSSIQGIKGMVGMGFLLYLMEGKALREERPNANGRLGEGIHRKKQKITPRMPLFMPGRNRSQLRSFTPIPAQRKEALGPALFYLGTIPTYSVSTQVHLSHPDRAYWTNLGLPGQHTFSELAGFLLPTFVLRLTGPLFTQIASELLGYLDSRRGLTPVRPGRRIKSPRLSPTKSESQPEDSVPRQGAMPPRSQRSQEGV
nr:hypothetical protein CFP56_76616 [Quercus suber]